MTNTDQDKHIIKHHYSDVTVGAMASHITSLTIVYLTVYSGADTRKHQISTSLAFVWAIHRWPVNSSHKWPVTQKMFPFEDVVMTTNSVTKAYSGPVLMCSMPLPQSISRPFNH